MKIFHCPHGCGTTARISNQEIEAHGLSIREEGKSRILVQGGLPVLVGCGWEDYQKILKASISQKGCFRQTPDRGLEPFVSIPGLEVKFTKGAKAIVRSSNHPLSSLGSGS